jgi:hypothetical protein
MSKHIHTTLALLALSLSLSLGTAACTAEDATVGDATAEDDVEEQIDSTSDAVITVPTSAEWVTAHNGKRKTWQLAQGGTYVALKWSTGLAAKAKIEADYWLKQSADLGLPIGHRASIYGENGLGNHGTGSWGQPKTAAVAVGTRWVDNEVGLAPPNNDHLTQVMWHASKYVGCYTAYKTKADGSTWSTQYCQYAAAGNCQIGAYSTWQNATMKETGCGGDCPPEGCF